MVGVGSRNETESESGISHFVEHMVFKGGKRFPTARDISEAIEGVGGVLNAATDREATVFWTRVPVAKLGLAVSVLSDMLLSPVLDEAEVAKERQVVIEELRMYEDNPQDYVQIAFDALMWPDHPLGWDVAGREETVLSFTADDCRDASRQAHAPVDARGEHRRRFRARGRASDDRRGDRSMGCQASPRSRARCCGNAADRVATSSDPAQR